MRVKLVTPPAIEPISLGEAKKQLIYDGGTFADQVTSVQSIAPGSHAAIADYDLMGTGIDVLGYDSIVLLESGTNGAGATVDAKIQEADDNTETLTLDVAPAADWEADDIITGQTSLKTCVCVAKLTALTYTVKDRSGTYTLGETIGVTGIPGKLADQGAAHPTFSGSSYTDVTDGAFTQVTTANDNATYEKAYTGVKQYIRVVSTVTGGPCEFGISVVKNAPTSVEDSLITDLITTAREHVEDILRRKLITQTWKYYLDEWPKVNYIKLPFGNLQSNAKATGTLTSSGVNVSNGDFITIDAKTYRFRVAPTVEGDIDIGVSATTSLDNLKAAINHTGTPGVQYICADAHPTVEATTKTDTVLTLQSILGGVAGNIIPLSTTAVTLTASGATLSGGITSAEIKYYDSDGLAETLTVTEDYIMEFNGDQCGRIVLPYGETWPSGALFSSNPIVIKFACGYGDAAADVPFKIKAAILRMIAKLFESKGEDVLGQTVSEDKTVFNLLQSRRLWDEF